MIYDTALSRRRFIKFIEFSLQKLNSLLQKINENY